MAANSAVNGWTWPNFELIQDFIVVLITCKNEEDPIKTKGARVLTTLYIDFSDAQGQLTPQSVVGFGPISNSSILLIVFIACKNEKYPIKNEVRVLTTFSPLYSEPL